MSRQDPISSQPKRLRLAADIGGTFTDVAAFDERTKRLLLGKSSVHAACQWWRASKPG